MKILIIGNTGSGKSTLAKILSDKLNIGTVIHLDKVFWKDGFNTMRPKAEQDILLYQNLKEEHVIMEGVYKTICDRMIKNFDVLIYLDIDKSTCLKNIDIRGSGDIEKVKSYYQLKRISRGSEIYSQGYHNKLLNNFTKTKFRIISNDYEKLITDLMNRKIKD